MLSIFSTESNELQGLPLDLNEISNLLINKAHKSPGSTDVRTIIELYGFLSRFLADNLHCFQRKLLKEKYLETFTIKALQSNSTLDFTEYFSSKTEFFAFPHCESVTYTWQIPSVVLLETTTSANPLTISSAKD